MKENDVHIPEHINLVSDTHWHSGGVSPRVVSRMDDDRGDGSMITLIWNGEEGKLQISKEFVVADRMVQLDGLVDWMAELQDLYEFMLAERRQHD